MYLYCNVRIVTTFPLEDVASIVSARVLGGVPFTGREDHILDEVPAVYSAQPILGTRFILMGEPDEEGYYLSTEGWSGEEASVGDGTDQAGDIDVSAMAAAILRSVDDFRIMDPETDPYADPEED